MPSIATLNNLGVSCLRNGHYGCGEYFLRKAVQQMRERVRLGPQHVAQLHSRQEEQTPSAPEDKTETRSIRQDETLEKTILIPASTLPPKEPLHSGSFLHTQGIFLHSEELPPTQTPHHRSCQEYILASTVLFNYAVSFHVQAAHPHTSKERNCSAKDYTSKLDAAFALYTKTRLILQQVMVVAKDLQQKEHTVVTFLSMATLNNMAYASYDLGHFDQSTKVLDLLACLCEQSAKWEASSPSRVDNDCRQLLDWHRSYFLLNTMCFHPPMHAAAAA